MPERIFKLKAECYIWQASNDVLRYGKVFRVGGMEFLWNKWLFVPCPCGFVEKLYFCNVVPARLGRTASRPSWAADSTGRPKNLAARTWIRSLAANFCFVKGLHCQPFSSHPSAFNIVVFFLECFAVNHCVRVFALGDFVRHRYDQRYEAKVSFCNIGVFLSWVFHRGNVNHSLESCHIAV